MNYYKRHLGDYAKDAGHLTMLEHGAYTLLLDRFYSTEQPIAAVDIYRVAHARSNAERQAVDAVLSEFFIGDGEGFANGRASEEIAKAAHQRAVNQEVGRLGGRPKGSKSAPKKEPNGNRIGSETETEKNPIHYSTTPNPPTEGTRARRAARPEDVSEQVWNDWNELRRKKRAPVTETVVASAREESVKARMTLDRFLAVWCARGSQGLQAEWLKPDERNGSETNYARSMREKYEQVAPLVAAKAPGTVRENPMDVIEGMSREQLRIAS